MQPLQRGTCLAVGWVREAEEVREEYRVAEMDLLDGKFVRIVAHHLEARNGQCESEWLKINCLHIISASTQA